MQAILDGFDLRDAYCAVLVRHAMRTMSATVVLAAEIETIWWCHCADLKDAIVTLSKFTKDRRITWTN